MVTPEQLDFLSAQLAPIWDDFEAFVLEDITRRIKGALDNQMTGSAELQASVGVAYGIDKTKILTELKKALKRSDQAVYNILEDCGLLNILQGNEGLEASGVSAISIDEHPELGQFVRDAIAQTKGDLHNFTQTAGFAVSTPNGMQFQNVGVFYQRQLDMALFNVQSGVVDHTQAMRTVVKNMADSGIQFVDFENGWRNRADVAVRRALLTGLNQMTDAQNREICDIIGTDLVEVTAHQGARPSHKVWQGKVFSLNGKTPGYKTLAEGTGYGTGAGLMGWNCRHNFNAYIPGTKPAWSKEELKNIDPADFYYDGKMYSCYEATQRQRAIETSMREEKRKLIGFKAADDTEAFDKASHKLKGLRSEYKQFSQAAGLKQRNSRAQVIGFDRKMSMEAHWANISYIKGIK